MDQPGVGKPGSMPAVNDGDGKVSQVPRHNAPFVTIVLSALLSVVQKSDCYFHFLFCFGRYHFLGKGLIGPISRKSSKSM